MIDMQATGQNILRLREAAGLSAKELQKKLMLASVQTIYHWQEGSSVPTIDNLIILAEVLGVPIDRIIVSKHIKPK